MAYHKQQELKEIKWQEEESFSYVDFLADFRGEFHDIRDDARFEGCLDNNVRKGVSISVTFEDAFAVPEIRELT